MKMHFENESQVVCGRDGQSTRDTFQVDCKSCIIRNSFQEAHQKAVLAREAAFEAQVPRMVSPDFCRLNAAGVMECYNCQGILFRERPRSLWSFHFVCAGCGTSMHPLTETGMCQ